MNSPQLLNRLRALFKLKNGIAGLKAGGLSGKVHKPTILMTFVWSQGAANVVESAL